MALTRAYDVPHFSHLTYTSQVKEVKEKTKSNTDCIIFAGCEVTVML